MRPRRERMVAKPRGSQIGERPESYAWTRNGKFLGETASPGGEGGRGGFRKTLILLRGPMVRIPVPSSGESVANLTSETFVPEHRLGPRVEDPAVYRCLASTSPRLA